LKQQDADVYATAQLAADCAEALGCHEMASGLLSIRLSRTGNDRLIWFRPEVPTEIEWAGNPDKPYEFAADGTTPMPHPRTSFARWKTTMRQRARPWRDCELEFASRLRLILLEFMVDRSLARLP
jgi:light-regulated signal transduction histidine kinase (bacteriophytochrome)